MNLGDIKIIDYFYSIIKRTYLASPPLKLEQEYKELETHQQTIIDNIIEEAVRRGLLILFQYRPRIKLFKTEIDENSTIIMDAEFRNKFKIFSINDIKDVLPYRSAGLLIFPVLPQLSPTGRFIYYGLFDYGELAKLISGLKTALTVFGVFPSFSVYYDHNTQNFVIKVFPQTYISREALIFCQLNPEYEFNIFENKISDLGLSGIELDLLIKYVRSVVYTAIGRLRSRFGSSISIGTQNINQDGDKLLSEAKSLEDEFKRELQEVSHPALPIWS